jgi:integrase
MKRRPPHSTSAPSLIERPLTGRSGPPIAEHPTDAQSHPLRAVLATSLGQSHPLRGLTLVADLKRIVAPLGESLLDHRDRALLLLGFGAALRRSELVALRLEHLRFEEEGLVLTLPRSKTNQEGRLETIAVAYGSEPTTCPVRAVRRWLAAAGIIQGPVFCGLTAQGGLRPVALGDRMVAHIVKRRCKAVGIDPTLVAGHSLRRGFATTAARALKSDRSIKRHGRWKSMAMLDRYIEDGTRWEENASVGIGL